MSKRYPKKQKKPVRAEIIPFYDRHHLCYTRRGWSATTVSELRRHHYCIIMLQKSSLHHFIHDNLEYIPPPSKTNAMAALIQLRMLDDYGVISDSDPIEKRLEILASLFDCVEQPTADGFRRQLEIIHEFKKSPSE